MTDQETDEDKLRGFGWDEQVAERFRAVERPDTRPGRVVRVDRGECDVMTTRGAERVVSDSVRAQDETAPATGDWVAVADSDEFGAAIAAIAPRGNVVVRRDPSEEVIEQVLVANIDSVIIVHGLDRPLPPGRLERFLVLAWDSGAEAAVVLTKSDLEDGGPVADVVRAVAPDIPTILFSSVTGAGRSEVADILRPRTTTALLGASGAGKSTLINAMAGEDLQEVGEVRDRDGKGRHTTITRDLVRLPSGALVVDTPGIRAVGVWDAEEALHRVFADIEQLATECRFGDCRHDSEPGCAVREAVDPLRVERHRALADELAVQRQRQADRERRDTGGRRPGGRSRGKRRGRKR